MNTYKVSTQGAHVLVVAENQRHAWQLVTQELRIDPATRYIIVKLNSGAGIVWAEQWA